MMKRAEALKVKIQTDQRALSVMLGGQTSKRVADASVVPPNKYGRMGQQHQKPLSWADRINGQETVEGWVCACGKTHPNTHKTCFKCEHANRCVELQAKVPMQEAGLAVQTKTGEGTKGSADVDMEDINAELQEMAVKMVVQGPNLSSLYKTLATMPKDGDSQARKQQIAQQNIAVLEAVQEMKAVEHLRQPLQDIAKQNHEAQVSKLEMLMQATGDKTAVAEPATAIEADKRRADTVSARHAWQERCARKREAMRMQVEIARNAISDARVALTAQEQKIEADLQKHVEAWEADELRIDLGYEHKIESLRTACAPLLTTDSAMQLQSAMSQIQQLQELVQTLQAKLFVGDATTGSSEAAPIAPSEHTQSMNIAAARVTAEVAPQTAANIGVGQMSEREQDARVAQREHLKEAEHGEEEKGKGGGKGKNHANY
jgi:hypothetical protein